MQNSFTITVKSWGMGTPSHGHSRGYAVCIFKCLVMHAVYIYSTCIEVFQGQEVHGDLFSIFSNLISEYEYLQ